MNQQRRGGLGRGLGALIPTGPVTAPAAPANESAPGGGSVGGATFREVPIDAITPNPRQPREHFDEDALAELVTSITEVGLLQPVVVREVGDDRYELVMGERRWRASREAGLTTIPAIVRETPDDALLRDALLENLHRQQLNPLEEAAAYQQLLEEFGATHEQLAERIGRSRSQVTNTIRLLNLPPAVQKRVAAGVLTAGHARALLGLDDPAAQERLATRIVAEGMSVRAVEEAVHVGDVGPAPAGERVRRATPRAPAAADVEARLSDYFETRVRIDIGRRKGKLVVEFGSIDDLERIVALMTAAPADEVPRPAAPATAATAATAAGDAVAAPAASPEQVTHGSGTGWPGAARS